MTKQYKIQIEPSSHKQRNKLPGHVRQRVKRIIDDLAEDPRPHNSQELDTADLDVPENVELRRIRLEKWRIIYAVNDVDKWVWVWGLRKRPLYDYEDLADLIESL